jgi:uncharacterized protein YgiM (DUF1202 family)
MTKLPFVGITTAAALFAAGTALAANMMTLQKDTAVAQQPDSSAKTLTTLNAGTQVTVIDTNGQWTHIQAGSVDGYVPTGSLK